MNTGITGFGTLEALASMPFDSRDEDSRPDDGWLARAKNLTVSQEFNVYATAICVRGKLAQSLRYSRTEMTLTTDGVQYIATAPCSGQQEIVGGGFEVGPIPEAVNVHSSFMQDDERDGVDNDRWYNEFDSFSNEPQYGSSFAICRKP